MGEFLFIGSKKDALSDAVDILLEKSPRFRGILSEIPDLANNPIIISDKSDPSFNDPSFASPARHLVHTIEYTYTGFRRIFIDFDDRFYFPEDAGSDAIDIFLNITDQQTYRAATAAEAIAHGVVHIARHQGSGFVDAVAEDEAVRITNEIRSELGITTRALAAGARIGEWRYKRGEGAVPLDELDNTPPYCFLAGAPITMWDGTVKPIEEIRPDDLVLSYDEKGGRFPEG